MSACRPVVRKSDVGAPPARLSAGAAPSLSILSAKRNIRGTFKSASAKCSTSSSRKRRTEENLDLEESDSEHSTVAEDQEENDSAAEEVKKGENVEEKVKKTRKKRRFRLTDSTAKSRRRAERKAQLAAERKEREEMKHEGEEEEEEKQESASPPPVQKPPMIRTYSPIQLLCDNLLRKLQAKDPEEYFAFPVTQSMAPDYHQVIKEPMDFSTMRSKIEANEYADVAAFRKDVELVVNNALTYNQPNTIYNVAAQKLDQIVRFYFSEPHLRYLFHALPFCKDIPLEKVGLTPKVRPRILPKVERNYAIMDDMTPSTILNSVDISLKSRLSGRRPQLRGVVPDCDSGKEPKCELGFLDNKDGAVCLNILNCSSSEQRSLTLGDIIGKLEEGTPGLCAPQEHKSSVQVPISFLSYGPFSSFAPQYDSTWATLCDRDSTLLLSCYGDKQSVTNAFALRSMVEDSGAHLIKLVDDLLDTLTDGEHSRTLSALRTEPDAKVPEIDSAEEMEKLLCDVESLENIGIDVSFVSDVRKLYGVEEGSTSPQDQLNKTGAMISDLALLQKNRLSSVPPATLSEQPPPSQLETNLAGKIQDQLHAQLAHYAKPVDIVSPAVIHSAVGLNEEDLDLLNEFFTPGTV
uniref:Bromo domain-containing protein n=1 Tax=Parascaris univalens TaxID=6257 RepID=A0A915AJ43_PARUN